MTQREVAPNNVTDQAKQKTREASPWIEPLGRFGYAAKGVVYAIVGVLAVQAAIGSGGATTDTRGALQQIVEAPFGQVLLGIVAVGLLGYAIWRFVQGFLDTENKGADAKGYLTRIGYAVVGVVYLGLAFSAVRLILGSSSGGGGDSTQQSLTARLMSQPLGQWLVGLVGVAVIGFGLYQMYKGYKAKFREKLKLGEMSQTEETWATRAGRIGFIARGVVFGIIGIFLIVAAVQAQPQEARGLGGALTTLAAQPVYGPLLLGAVALGLIAYAAFCFVEARYRRMLLR